MSEQFTDQAESQLGFELSPDGVLSVAEEAIAKFAEIDQLKSHISDWLFLMSHEIYNAKREAVSSLTMQVNLTAEILDKVAPQPEGRTWLQRLEAQYESRKAQSEAS